MPIAEKKRKGKIDNLNLNKPLSQKPEIITNILTSELFLCKYMNTNVHECEHFLQCYNLLFFH